MIAFGDSVICRLQDEKSTTILKVSAGDQKVCKTYISMKNVIGTPYGSVFHVAGKDLELASLQPVGREGEQKDDEEGAEGGSLRKDNRGLNDTNTSQKLKDADIREMRKQGCSGEEIIKTLIANSDTWNTKTEYSQEKWLTKKRRKYSMKLRIARCTPATVCEVYHSKSIDKISHLRPDSLSRILSQSSIYPGCRVLVVDSLVGLIVGSVAYRLRGMGEIFAVYHGQQPHFELVNTFNLDEASTKIIQPVPSNELAAAGHDVRRLGFANLVGVESATVETPALPAGTMPCATTVSELGIEEPAPQQAQGEDRKRSYNKSGRHPHDLRRIRQHLREGFDSLILATKFYPLPILKEVISLLLPSSPFVLYFEFMEPLVECYLYLLENALAVRLSLSDTWTREFQTLPNRVHPAMFMSVSSGYLLTGIYVGTVGEADSARVS